MTLITRGNHRAGRRRSGTTLVAVLVAVTGACSSGTDSDTTLQPTPTTSSTTTEAAPSTSSTQPTTTTTTVKARPAVLVIGDWGAGTDAQAEVSAAMEHLAGSLEVEAIVTTGDNFYTDDEANLMAPFQWAVDEGIPFWIARGNHDVESSERISDINTVFGDPPRWAVYEWHAIDVVVLDSNQVGNEDQIAFLRDHMATSTNPAIMVFHHPALSCSLHGDTASVLDAWVPLFDEGVFLVLAGHDHNYQQFADDGITYVVSGGGGAGLYELRECPNDHPPRIAGEAAHHFLTLELGAEQVVLTAYRSDLSVIDTVELDLPWSVGPEPSSQGDQTPVPMEAPVWWCRCGPRGWSTGSCRRGGA